MKEYERLRALERPQGLIDVVLDTDTYNEVDDQFALAYMMKAPERLNMLAITAAPFLNKKAASPAIGMELSYDEIEKLLTFMDRRDMLSKVFKGSDRFLTDEETPVDSPAARRIAELAMHYTIEKPLYVVAIGAITNVASAILLQPEIAEKMVVVWLGGHALHYKDNREFNLYQDIAAARVVFKSGVPLVMLPCQGVVSGFSLSGPELLQWLGDRDPLCDYLARNTIREAETYAKGKPWTRVIWDVTAVAWLLDEKGEMLYDRVMPRPVPEYDNLWGENPNMPLCKYVYYIRRDLLLRDLVSRLTGEDVR